ncbi:hypothetical protein GCM10023339_32470 [Alloalcanivorax gelatiniphagus]
MLRFFTIFVYGTPGDTAFRYTPMRYGEFAIMRFLLPFFCLFLLAACQDNRAPEADYEDDFLLVAHQTLTPNDSDYDQDMSLQAIVRNRVDQGAGSGLWIRTTLPWLRIGSGQLDTRHLERLGERAKPLRRFLDTGTLSRVEDGEIAETRIADPALHEEMVERFGDKVEQLLDQATATSVPLPNDPRPGDTWQASASLWGLPKVTADYRVLDRDGDRVLIALTLAGEGVDGEARMIARWPSGMPEALRLHSTASVPDQDATLEQRLLLISQRHYPYPVQDWDVDPLRVEMYAETTERQLNDPRIVDPDQRLSMRDQDYVNTLLDSAEQSLFYQPDQLEEARLLTEGDWSLAHPLQQQASFHFTGFDGPAPDGLLLNRLGETGGFYGLATPMPSDVGRDPLVLTGDGKFDADGPIKLTGAARIWTDGEPVTLKRGDGAPESLKILDWQDQRVDLQLGGDLGQWRAQPLDGDGEPLPYAVIYRPFQQADPSARVFVERLTLDPPLDQLTLITEHPIATLRLTPLRESERPLTFTVRPLPDDRKPGTDPGGVRHQASPLPEVPDDTGALLDGLTLQGLDDNRLRVTGPPGLRLCTLTPEDGADYHGTPLHFVWDKGDAKEHLDPGFELRTEDDQVRYFYGRELNFQARCPTAVETVTLTREQPGCARFDGDNGVRLGDDCGGIEGLDYAALDDTGLALQPLGEDDDGVRRFWGKVKKVRLLRADGDQQRDLQARFEEVPQ